MRITATTAFVRSDTIADLVSLIAERRRVSIKGSPIPPVTGKNIPADAKCLHCNHKAINGRFLTLKVIY